MSREYLFGGAIGWRQFLFKVVSPSENFTKFSILIKCSFPVLIYEYF